MISRVVVSIRASIWRISLVFRCLSLEIMQACHGTGVLPLEGKLSDQQAGPDRIS